MESLLIYGAYGYTGERIARTAVDRGHTPVLAGRNPDRLHSLAGDLGVRSRAFGVDDDIETQLDGIEMVLNCAGPFESTADQFVEACLNRGVDYLDITGELPVFERLARRDEEARAAETTLLPGVGFDVVPTDCLAAHLTTRLDEPTHLSIAISADGSLSGGTLKTLINGLGSGGAVRTDGHLRAVPTGSNVRVVDFGAGNRTVLSVPLGDLTTAFRSTGVPNITTYVAVPDGAVHAIRLGRPLERLASTDPGKRLLTKLVDRFVDGPTDAERADAETIIWAEAWSETTGKTVESTLRTPDPYDVTVEAALAAAENVVDVDSGFQTPATAFGPEFAVELPGVSRKDR